MRKVLLILSIVAVPVLCLGMIEKIVEWDLWAAILFYMLLAGTIFCTPFLLKSKSGRRIYTLSIVIISGFILISIFILGALYKIQHWEGGDTMIIISLIGTALVTVPLLARFLFEKVQKKNAS